MIQTALYQTVSLTFFTLVYTVWRKEPFLNWDQEESLYWMMTGQDTLHDERISFGVILAMFAVIQFLFLMVEGIIFLLCFFITSHVWAGWIVCESLMIAGRLSALNISWEKWRYWKRFGNTVVESIFILILLIVLGRLISGRKDYYEKK